MHDDLVRDIYERLGGIQAKLDDVVTIRNTANEADKKASEANHKADENARAIEGLSATLKWAIGIIATILVPLTLFVLGKIFG